MNDLEARAQSLVPPAVLVAAGRAGRGQAGNTLRGQLRQILLVTLLLVVGRGARILGRRSDDFDMSIEDGLELVRLAEISTT